MASPETRRLEDFLEDPAKVHFYDLLGGLSDNLLTIGTFAGTFLTCEACGKTFTLRDQGWACVSCGQSFEMQIKPALKPGSPFEAKVKIAGLDKPRCNPHWYFQDENWSVAEFLTQVFRLPAEEFLPQWLKYLQSPIQNESWLETVLCWPRFPFGKKTIQPDCALGFSSDVVFFEFKRPGRATVPTKEIVSQIAFAAYAAERLQRRWHLVVVPGRVSTVRASALDYLRAGMEILTEMNESYAVGPEFTASIAAMRPEEIAAAVRVIGWEPLLARTRAAIVDTRPPSWTRDQVLAKLEYFQQSRAELKLLDSVQTTAG
jgi:hypothetical protein